MISTTAYDCCIVCFNSNNDSKSFIFTKGKQCLHAYCDYPPPNIFYVHARGRAVTEGMNLLNGLGLYVSFVSFYWYNVCFITKNSIDSLYIVPTVAVPASPTTLLTFLLLEKAGENVCVNVSGLSVEFSKNMSSGNKDGKHLSSNDQTMTP